MARHGSVAGETVMMTLVLCAVLGLASAMSTSPARAAVGPVDRNPLSAPLGAAPVQDPRIKPGRARDLRPLRPRQDVAPPPRATHTGVNRGAGGGRPLMNSPARVHAASQSSRRDGMNRVATDGHGATSSGSAVSKRNPVPVPKLTKVPRYSAIGGPRVQSVGRLGGAIGAGINRGSAVDGTQFHHRS